MPKIHRLSFEALIYIIICKNVCLFVLPLIGSARLVLDSSSNEYWSEDNSSNGTIRPKDNSSKRQFVQNTIRPIIDIR
jgi:hypothetical protein